MVDDSHVFLLRLPIVFISKAIFSAMADLSSGNDSHDSKYGAIMVSWLYMVLGETTFDEIEAVMAERDVIEPEMDLTPEVMIDPPKN